MSAERGGISQQEFQANSFPRPKPVSPEILHYRPDSQVSVESYFENIPLRSGTNLSWLKPYLEEKPLPEAKEQIQSRYEKLSQLSKNYGVEDSLNVNFDLAHALVDGEYFQTLSEEIRLNGRVLKTARHEMGHAHVAHHVGWKVTYISVIPKSDYLGVTYSMPTSSEDLYTHCQKSAAIAFGGIYAAQMLGDEPRGGGSDVAKAHALARLINRHYPQVSEATFLHDAQNLALSALRASGNSTLERDSKVLLAERQRT